jgi:hypothetical protein
VEVLLDSSSDETRDDATGVPPLAPHTPPEPTVDINAATESLLLFTESLRDHNLSIHHAESEGQPQISATTQEYIAKFNDLTARVTMLEKQLQATQMQLARMLAVHPKRQSTAPWSPGAALK